MSDEIDFPVKTTSEDTGEPGTVTSLQSDDDEESQDLAPRAPAGFAASRAVQASPHDEIDFPVKASQLQSTLDKVADADPDKVARILRLSKQFDSDPSFTQNYLDDMQKAAHRPPGWLVDEVERKFPGTTNFLSNPQNAAIAHDDIENLRDHESLVQHAKVAHGFFDSFKAGLESSLAGLIARNKLPDLQLPPQADQTWAEYLGAQAGGLAGDLPGMALVGAGTLPALGPAGSTVASFALPAAVKQAVLAHIQNGDSKSATELLGRLYDNYKESFKQALVGVGTVAGGALGGKLAGGVGKFAGEAIAMPTVASAEEGKLPTVKDIAGGAMVMGGLHGLGAGGEAFFGRVAADKASESGEFYDRAGDLAANSKLRERAPEAYRQQLDALTKDSSVSDAYIPVRQFEEYFQSKRLDPEVVAQELGVTDSLTEARTQGEDGNVQVPFGKFAQTFGGTEHWQGLKDDVKFSQDDLTPRQNAEVQKAVAEFTQKAEADTTNVVTPESDTTNVVSPIQAEISRQLEAAGLSAGEVKYNPQLVDAFYSTLGKKMGVDPQELFQRFPIRVERSETATSALADKELFQSATKPAAPAFYSKLTKTVEEKLGNSATPEQVLGTIKDVKPEERKWSGIDEFLKGKEKVSKAELLEFLRANQLEVREVTKGATENTEPIVENISKEDMTGGSFGEGVFKARFSNGDYLEVKAKSFAAGEKAALKAMQKKIDAGLEYRPNYVKESDTKFEKHTLPGGENYREVLFTLPERQPVQTEEDFQLWAAGKHGKPFRELTPAEVKTAREEFKDAEFSPLNEDQYRSSHWDEPNVLAHVRLNDRTDVEGKKVLHVEEIQSDWHQAGRKKGYKGDEQTIPPGHKLISSAEFWKSQGKPEQATRREWYVVDPDNRIAGMGPTEETAKADFFKVSHPAVPDAPFRKTWHEFALKRILRMAAEGGYDRVSWTTGEQQAERYDLSKQVSEVQYKKTSKGTYDILVRDHNDHKIADENGQTEAQLEALLGKELTQKIVDGHGEAANDPHFEDSKTLSGLDLKVGGEGMKGFYDKILPDFANKFGKKYGAKVGETGLRVGPDEAAAQRAMRSGDSSAIGEATSDRNVKVHSIDITPALKDAALNEGFSLFQPGDEGPRGRIRIGDTQLSIDLLKTADRSTFLHEVGHAFLELMGHAASDPNAPEEVKADYATVLKFLGVDSREAIGREHHEKWAKAFETYLAEGRAPSEALRGAFDRFKDWLVSVYGDIKRALGVELSPEIRGVMDRLLATQEEIERARQTIGQREELVKGLPPEVARRLADLEARAKSQAESALLKEQMTELTSKNREFLDKERARIEKEVTAQVKDQPVYRAMDMVAKASRKNAAEQAHLFLEDRVTDKVAGAFEAAAEVHGFAGGEELAKAIVEADTHGGLAGEVKARVDAAMQAQHGPLMDTDAIRAKALEAVHNDRSTELLALERQALQDLVKKADVRAEIAKRNRKEAQVEAQAAQREARNILDRKAVKDIRPSTYLTAERNAAVRVSKALAKGDYEAAATAKREQLVNHALAREAMRAQKEIEKTVEKLADRAKDGRDFQKMPYAYARQLDEMLARFGFKDAPEAEDLPTLIQIAQGMAQRGELADDIANSTGLRQDSRGEWGHETLSEFVTRQNESYFGLELPSVVMEDGKPYRELTLPELSDLEDTVQTLVTLGKNRDRFLEAFEMADINEAGKTFAESVRENFGEPEAKAFRLGAGNTSAGEKVLGTLASIPKVLARWMDTMLTTCHKLDGLKTDGPAKEFIYRRMSEAENRRLQRTRDEMARLDAIFAKHFEEGELGKYKDSFVRVGDNNVSRLQLLSMALNWGNLGNRDRITRAEGMTEGQVEELLFKNLGKRDFDFAQDVWTYLDRFRPEIKKLEMDVNGVEPKFVEASPVITPWGTYEGGYYPIHYDPERSAAAYRNTEQTTALYKQFGAAKAQTEQGHTVARVNTLRRPIKYSLDVLTDHVEDVIHDLEFRKPVIDVARFLQQKDAKGALLNALGVRGYNSVNDWLKAVASGPSEPLHFDESAARWLRFRTTMFYMGYRLASAPKIAVENLNNISSELGVSEAARAIKDYYTGDSGLHEFVTSKSEFMRQRAEHLDRDMSDVYDKYSGEESVLAGVHKFAFWTHAILDQGVSFPLWTHVFKEAMAAEENEAKATHLADEAVKRTFMSGGAVDQAAIMRGSESHKALTVALGYQSMMWNRYSQQLFATGQALRQGRPMDALAIAARAHFYSFVMPAAIGILTHELVRNSQGPGNPEDEKKRILADALKEATPLKFIPVARDVFPYFVDKSLGMRGSDLQVTPLERAAQTLLEPAAEAFRSAFTGQPLTPRFGEKTAGAISLTAGVPKEFNDVVFNFLDWQRDHGAATWRDFVSRRVKH